MFQPYHRMIPNDFPIFKGDKGEWPDATNHHWMFATDHRWEKDLQPRAAGEDEKNQNCAE